LFGRGRHRPRRGGQRVGDLADAARARQEAASRPVEGDTDEPEPADGPFDVEDAPDDDVARLDLGSIRLPLPDGAQLQVEVDQAGPVRAVHVLTEFGQLTVGAFAAPRGESLWAEVRAEIVEQLRADGAQVEQPAGQWGREVHAVTPQVTLRFVGVDGPRWMLRGVAAAPAERHPQLVESLYEMLRGTVVVRGSEPQPVRNPLPLTLPEPMAEQLKQAAAARQEQQRE